MKRGFLTISFFLLAIFGIAQSSAVKYDINQDISPVFGEPRKPHGTSFYNPRMYVDDWVHNTLKVDYRKQDLSLFGVEKNIQTSGKTIVYDASEETIVENYRPQGNNSITINNGKILVEAENRVLQIPVKFVGDNTISESTLQQKDRQLLTDYVAKSLRQARCTPSKVQIEARNNNYHLSIFKSEYSGEEYIIKRFNMRTAHLKKIDDTVFLAFR